MIESKTASTVLQDQFKVKVGTEVYKVAPPTLNTIIRVSELIAKLPKEENQDVLIWSLDNAKQARVIGDIVATIVLGANNLDKEVVRVKSFLGFRYKKKVSLYKEIKEQAIGMEYEPLSNLLVGLFKEGLDVDAFFLLTTFLRGQNILKRTKETTLSGQ